MAGPVVLTFHGLGTPLPVIHDVDKRMWISTALFVSILSRVGSDVSITFDDGFECCSTIALPELLKRRLVARFFVCPGLLGQDGYLTLEQVTLLKSAGMSIGSHGMHHRSWRGLDEEQLKIELLLAKEQLEDLLGQSVEEVACPLGEYDRHVLKLLRAAGYKRVFTSDRLPSTGDAWLVPRFTVRDGDSLEYISKIAEGGEPRWKLPRRVKMLLKKWR